MTNMRDVTNHCFGTEYHFYSRFRWDGIVILNIFQVYPHKVYRFRWRSQPMAHKSISNSLMNKPTSMCTHTISQRVISILIFTFKLSAILSLHTPTTVCSDPRGTFHINTFLSYIWRWWLSFTIFLKDRITSYFRILCLSAHGGMITASDFSNRTS